MKSVIQQKIWNSIRVFKNFSVKDIQFSNGDEKFLNYHTVRKYLIFLERAGYVRLVGEQEYKLIRSTGRYAPCVCRQDKNGNKCRPICFDANKKEYIALAKTYRQRQINEKAKARLPLILKSVADKESFKLRDIFHISGEYNRAKRDLRALQTLGLVKCIKGHENGAPKTFKIIKNNKEGVKMGEDFIPILAKARD